MKRTARLVNKRNENTRMRRVRIVQILEPVKYKTEQDREAATLSFLKSSMNYDEIQIHANRLINAGWVRKDVNRGSYETEFAGVQ